MPVFQTPPAVFGPLPVKVQTGLSGLSFLFEPEGARPLEPGERRSFARLDVGSNAAYQGDTQHFIYNDLEQNSLRVGVAQGSARGEWGVQASILARTGGVLDAFVSWWHQTVIPFHDPYFAHQAHQQVRIQVSDGANQLQQGGSALALTSLALTGKRALAPGLSARAFIKLPVSGRSSYLDNGALDVGVGLLGELPPRAGWTAQGNLNLVRAGTTAVGQLHGGARFLASSVVALERRVSPRTALVVQAEDTAFAFNRGLPHRGDRLPQMSFGAWHQATADTLWHASFSENIYPFQVTSYTPDFMLSLGLVRRR